MSSSRCILQQCIYLGSPEGGAKITNCVQVIKKDVVKKWEKQFRKRKEAKQGGDFREGPAEGNLTLT